MCVVWCSAHDWSRISQTRSDLIWPVIHFCLATYVLVRTTQFTSRIYAYYKSLYAYIHTYIHTMDSYISTSSYTTTLLLVPSSRSL